MYKEQASRERGKRRGGRRMEGGMGRIERKEIGEDDSEEGRGGGGGKEEWRESREEERSDEKRGERGWIGEKR